MTVSIKKPRKGVILFTSVIAFLLLSITVFFVSNPDYIFNYFNRSAEMSVETQNDYITNGENITHSVSTNGVSLVKFMLYPDGQTPPPYEPPQECADEGESVPVIPDAPECCGDLKKISCVEPNDSGDCPLECDGSMICAACGDGECGLGENKCNCPQDCEEEDVCVGEGEVGSSFENESCCSGLEKIDNSTVDDDGSCIQFRNGTFMCAACGDGECGSGENKCNCPDDCGEVEPSCIEEGGEGLVNSGSSCCSGLEQIRATSEFGLVRPDEDTCDYDDSKFYCTKCGDGVCGDKEDRCNCPEDCATQEECIGEGDVGEESSGDQCCAGLDKIEHASLIYQVVNQNDSEPTCVFDETKFYCAKCPNGACGAGENKCNCPKDCGLLTSQVLGADSTDPTVVEEVVAVPVGGDAKHTFKLYDLFNTGSYGHTYKAYACGCEMNNEDECECITDYAESQEYKVEEPSLNFSVDASGYCDDDTCEEEAFGEFILNTNGNREWFKYNVVSEDSSHEAVLWDKGWGEEISFCGSQKMGYEFDLHLCHTRTGDETEPLTDCEQTPVTSVAYYLGCEYPQVDLGIASLDVVSDGDTEEIYEGDNITAFVDIANFSDVDIEGFELGLLIVSPDTGEHMFTETVSSNEVLQQGEIMNFSFDIGALPVNSYIASAAVQVLGDQVDVDSSNNHLETVFVVLSEDPCDITCEDDEYVSPDCECVECYLDEHCGNDDRQICNMDNNTCECNHELCGDRMQLNSSCTACICANTCPDGQYLDDQCYCRDDICDKTNADCGEKLILNEECECVAVECESDYHCPGLEYCEISSRSCVCGLCGAGLVPNSDCTECRCATGCPSGQIQRSDCSCYQPPSYTPSDPGGSSSGSTTTGQTDGTDGTDGQDGTDGSQDSDTYYGEGVEIEIEGPDEGQVVKVDEKVLLEYKIVSEGDADPDKVEWYVDGEKVGSGNFISYSTSEAGEYTIELRYNDEKQDSVGIEVIKTVAEEKSKAFWGLGILGYFLAAVVILLVIGFILWLLFSARDNEY